MTSEDRDDLHDEAGTTGSGNDEEASRSSRSRSTGDDADAGTTGGGKVKRKRKQLPIWQETILLIGIALVLAIVIKAFFVQAFYIPSESMEPGLIKNDRILVQKVSYWGSGEPERGDVVVFKDPGGWLGPGEDEGPSNLLAEGMARIGLYPTGGHLVKRVIGVSGDHVTCCDEQGRLSINGHVMDEGDYIKGDAECAAPQSPINCNLDVTIPSGYLLVMGDNRGNSRDSTAHMCANPKREQCPPSRGLVPVEDVVGKVFALVWPKDRFHRIKRPAVFEDVPDSE
ncbi:signal peptidase I [Nocardioides sp. JQ2195]|uniref:signal peptidase I n=1 Tax=Nocardioides sp. JQ2195 TaxID=2592334 RepID=UPI00143ED10C|nr:signal peptidase I [Nocardioides sp. JQ2195]QIX26218.1 signal peptidase I [Nocardioides sp. JQ2195]